MRNSMLRHVMLALAVTLPATGCLVGDTIHTLYLDPDGAFTWTVIEQVIRSDSADAAERDREEAEYLARSFDSDQPIARGLRKLHPVSLRTVVERETRPFTVVSEARFTSIEDVFQRLLDGAGLEGRAELTRQEGVVRLTVTAGQREIEIDDEGADVDLLGLMGGDEDMRIVLTRGRFVDAVGYRLSGDGATATRLEQAATGNEPVTYSLAWTE